jgi:hypothetical protein
MAHTLRKTHGMAHILRKIYGIAHIWRKLLSSHIYHDRFKIIKRFSKRKEKLPKVNAHLDSVE